MKLLFKFTVFFSNFMFNVLALATTPEHIICRKGHIQTGGQVEEFHLKSNGDGSYTAQLLKFEENDKASNEVLISNSIPCRFSKAGPLIFHCFLDTHPHPDIVRGPKMFTQKITRQFMLPENQGGEAEVSVIELRAFIPDRLHPGTVKSYSRSYNSSRCEVTD